MLIVGDDRMSRISTCIDAAAQFLLSREQAIAIAEGQLATIIDRWDPVCKEAELPGTDRALLWGRQFLNPYAFDNLRGDANHLKSMAEEASR